ncbi:DUF4350 domain-containing protein [Humibacter antri]
MTTTALSRTPRQSLKRARGWIVLVAILVIGAGIAAVVQLSLASTSTDPMGASNPAQQGGQALARVLAEQGVDVRPAGSLAAARQAASGRGDTTVLLSDPNDILDASQLRSVLALGSDLVAIDPGYQQLTTMAPGASPAGERASVSSSPHCSVAAAQNAGSVSGVRAAFRATGAAVGCFPVGAGASAVVQTSTAGTTVSVVGAGLFDNEGIARSGNAALAIGLLGQHHTLVWYLPSEADAGAAGPPTLAELTPGWLTPAIVLLIAVTVGAAIWRGRRFGPLVMENLPVVVRAGETVQGRARLYRTASARTHALDSLRVGALRRIASLCALPRSAHADQVAASAAALTGWPAEQVRDVLLDGRPETDSAALDYATRLADLEQAVRAAVRAA